MDSPRSLNSSLEAIAWGSLLILWGVTLLFDFVPLGVGIAGSGLILLGLNAWRSLKGIPTKSGTTTVGILALVGGGLELARPLLQPALELSDWAILAMLLIVWGGILLAGELLHRRKPGIEHAP